MKATLVIPCLNAAATLESVLQGVNEQRSRNDLRVVVVDNGSTDDTENIARRLADDFIVEMRRGSFAARNAGLAACGTEWMLSLDADTRPVRDDWADLHLEALSAAPPTAVGTAGPLLPEPTGDWWAGRADVTPHPSWADGQPLYAVGGNRCVRTGLVRFLGGFPAVGADDAALGRIAATRGLGFVWVPEAPVFHRNAAGIGGYYRQMKKVGGYLAEEGERPPYFWPRQAARVARNVARLPERGRRETLAEVTKTLALTHGLSERWRTEREAAGSVPARAPVERPAFRSETSW